MEIKKVIQREAAERMAAKLKQGLIGHISSARRTEPFVVDDLNTPKEVIHLAVERIKDTHPDVQARHCQEGPFDTVQFLF